jgi:hypothetical protein
VRRGGIWAKHMGLLGANGNTLGEHIGNNRQHIGNLMGTHWELEGNMLGTKEKMKSVCFSHFQLIPKLIYQQMGLFQTPNSCQRNV